MVGLSLTWFQLLDQQKAEAALKSSSPIPMPLTLAFTDWDGLDKVGKSSSNDGVLLGWEYRQGEVGGRMFGWDNQDGSWGGKVKSTAVKFSPAIQSSGRPPFQSGSLEGWSDREEVVKNEKGEDVKIRLFTKTD
jgi:hypothetical protein